MNNKNNADKSAADGDVSDLITRVRKLEVPWYKDRRFWGGVVALPAMLAGGWIMDAAFLKQDGAIDMLHGALGTQKAVSDRLRTNPDYRAAIAAALAQEIDANHKTLVDALVALIEQEKYESSLDKALAERIRLDRSGIQAAISDKFAVEFLRRTAFESDMDKAVARRNRILYADVMTLGAQRTEEIRFGFKDPRAPEHCTYSTFEELAAQKRDGNPLTDLIDTQKCQLNFSQASVMDQSALFVAPPGQKIDIRIGIAVNRLDQAVLVAGDFSSEALFDPVTHYKFGDLVDVTLGGEAISPLTNAGGATDHLIGKTAYLLRVFTSKGNTVRGGDINATFPLQALNFKLLEGKEDYVITIALIVQRSDAAE